MNKVLCFFLIILALPTAVSAGSTDDQKGLQLFRKHHYQDAARLMYAQLAGSAPGMRPETRRNFGMACLANAQFYDRLHLAARSMQVNYLQRLVQSDDQHKSTASHLARLYLGKALLADGQPESAISALTRFLDTPDINANDRYEAQIALGVAFHEAGQMNRAEKALAQVPAEVPQAAALLAAAYQRTGIHKENVIPLLDKATAELHASQKRLPVQSASALLTVYSHLNDMPKGFDILARTDLKTFAREEVIDTHKVLRFYDAGLLRSLSDFYNQAAINAFNDAKKSADKRISLTAAFLSGEAYAFSRQMNEASRAMDELLAATPPKTILRRARIRKTVYSQAGNPEMKWGDLLTPNSNVAQVSDIILLCAQLGVDCPDVITHATSLWKQAQGRPPVGLGMALGRYYRSRQDHSQALRYLESARDKSRKNRIEANPPALLADLAWAYFKNRQFSEALEIYFNMSKQFPAVRQIQVALQGIYSMEQQSAGDAKIF